MPNCIGTVLSQIPGRTSLPRMPCVMITVLAKHEVFYQVEAREGKALPLDEDSRMSLRLGTTSRVLSLEHKALLGL